MRRFRGGFGLALLTGLLSTLLVAPSGAQNLLTNPNFEDDILGWEVADLTTVIGFPLTGGVDLESTNPGAGGISQCVDRTLWLPGVARVSAGFQVTLPPGNTSGIVIGQLATFATPDCTGEPLETAALDPKAEVGVSPENTPLFLAGVASPSPGATSARIRVFGIQPVPPAAFKFNVNNAFMEQEGSAPSGPDLTPALTASPQPTRNGPQFRLFALTVQNDGESPSEGEWSVTITAPPGSRLGCPPETPFSCMGDGTTTLTITSSSTIFGANQSLTIPVFVEIVNIEPGNYKLHATVMGGGDTKSSNNGLDISLPVAPSRDSTRTTEDAPLTTSGRNPR